MRDYIFERETGQGVPVAQMSTAEIHDVLRDGFKTDGCETAEAITERLRLELLIREKGMRP